MSTSNKLLCINHPNRKAKNYCEACKLFICDSCCFQDKHSKHIEQIKPLSELVKPKFIGLNEINKSSLSKLIELFQFIVNYDSNFMSFDLNHITNQINEKIDEYINQLVNLKIQFKMILSEKIDIMSTIMQENENQVIESQGKILNLINNENKKYFTDLNTCLEQLRLNKNSGNIMSFVKKYDELLKQSFDDDKDFNNKYNFYKANLEIIDNAKKFKENYFDKLLQPFFSESSKKINSISQQIISEEKKNITNFKNKFEEILKNIPEESENQNDSEEENEENIPDETAENQQNENKESENSNWNFSEFKTEKLTELCKIAQSNQNKVQREFLIQYNDLSWQEKNTTQIIAINQSNSTCYIYNILTNKIEEIKTNIKFPMHFSYINLPPFVYISGGKESKDISKLYRTGENSFSCEKIAQLKEARTHHCSIYIKSINSILFISGSKIKSCEKYNLTENKVETFPALKTSREKCCACILNNDDLYVFFGFDRTKNKFESSIEKININECNNWDVITVSGSQNLMKKQNFACLPFDYDNKKGVIITGGINSLRNETKETVYFDYVQKKVESFGELPCNSSFTNSFYINFNVLGYCDEFYNISNEFNVIKFSPDSQRFSKV